MGDADSARHLWKLFDHVGVAAGRILDAKLMSVKQHAVDTRRTGDSRPILVPIDLSHSATHVLAVAQELANCMDRPLIVLHVLHDSIECPGQYTEQENSTGSMPIAEIARNKLQRLIDEVVSSPNHGGLHSVLVEGVPARRILEIAEREDPKMIVMGSSGRTGIPRLVMGSVAEAVVRASVVPITIVKGAPG